MKKLLVLLSIALTGCYSYCDWQIHVVTKVEFYDKTSSVYTITEKYNSEDITTFTLRADNGKYQLGDTLKFCN